MGKVVFEVARGVEDFNLNKEYTVWRNKLTAKCTFTTEAVTSPMQIKLTLLIVVDPREQVNDDSDGLVEDTNRNVFVMIGIVQWCSLNQTQKDENVRLESLDPPQTEKQTMQIDVKARRCKLDPNLKTPGFKGST